MTAVSAVRNIIILINFIPSNVFTDNSKHRRQRLSECAQFTVIKIFLVTDLRRQTKKL